MSEHSVKLSISWPVALTGIPISILALFIGTIFDIGIDSGPIGYIYTMSLFFLVASFFILSWVFSVYTIVRKFKEMSIFRRFFYILVILFLNGMSGYVALKLWRGDDVKPMSFKGKTTTDVFSIFCYFLVFVSIALPCFIARNKFN